MVRCDDQKLLQRYHIDEGMKEENNTSQEFGNDHLYLAHHIDCTALRPAHCKLIHWTCMRTTCAVANTHLRPRYPHHASSRISNSNHKKISCGVMSDSIQASWITMTIVQTNTNKHIIEKPHSASVF